MRPGPEPGRAVVAGQGLAKVSGPQDTSPQAQFASWVQKSGAVPRVLLHAGDSLVPTPADDLRRITTPVLVAIGDRHERSDADELAALLPAGRYACVPGDHAHAFAAPEFAAALRAFLTATR